MFKLIILVLGLAVGFGGGVYYSIQNPKEAADLNVKQQEWIDQGKQEANKWFKAKLDDMITKQSATVTPPKGVSGFANLGGGSSTSAVSTDALKALKTEVEVKIAEPKK